MDCKSLPYHLIALVVLGGMVMGGRMQSVAQANAVSVGAGSDGGIALGDEGWANRVALVLQGRVVDDQQAALLAAIGVQGGGSDGENGVGGSFAVAVNRKAVRLVEELMELGYVRNSLQMAYWLVTNVPETVDDKSMLQARRLLGVGYEKLGKLERAIDCYRATLKDAARLGNEEMQLLLNLDVAGWLGGSGDWAASERVYRYALKEGTRLDLDEVETRAIVGLVEVARVNGRLGDANTLLDSLERESQRAKGEKIGRLLNQERLMLLFDSGKYDDAMRLMDSTMVGDDGRVPGFAAMVKGLSMVLSGSLWEGMNELDLEHNRLTLAGEYEQALAQGRTVLSMLAKMRYGEQVALYESRCGDLEQALSGMPALPEAPLVDGEWRINSYESQNTDWGWMVVTVPLGVGLLTVLLLVIRRRRKQLRTIADTAATEDVGEKPEEPVANNQVAEDVTLVAIGNLRMSMQNVICAKAKGHFFMLVYVDEGGEVKAAEIDSRTPRKMRIGNLQDLSAGRLLECKRGYLVNPAFINADLDRGEIRLGIPAAERIVQSDMVRLQENESRFFDCYPFPIATTPGKNFGAELREWEERFGAAGGEAKG